MNAGGVAVTGGLYFGPTVQLVIRGADLPLIERLETDKEKPGIDGSPAWASLATREAGHAFYRGVSLDHFLNIEQRRSHGFEGRVLRTLKAAHKCAGVL